jgi:hypothetical protein
MLGWHISVYRKTSQRFEPADSLSSTGSLLAQWQGDVDALSWIIAVCETENGRLMGGDGYPFCYTARCDALKSTILGGPPGARKVWIHGPDDIIDYSKWKGSTFIDPGEFDRTDDNEWLFVEAWDES